eukprot:jgi/Bigna1/89042/estExt_fgenesh1_pg.C_420149
MMLFDIVRISSAVRPETTDEGPTHASETFEASSNDDSLGMEESKHEMPKKPLGSKLKEKAAKGMATKADDGDVTTTTTPTTTTTQANGGRGSPQDSSSSSSSSSSLILDESDSPNTEDKKQPEKSPMDSNVEDQQQHPPIPHPSDPSATTSKDLPKAAVKEKIPVHHIVEDDPESESDQEVFDENKDYYEVLGVNSGATDSDIRKAYRERALKYHPDRNSPGKKEIMEKFFNQVAEAYQVLSNEDERKKYDQVRSPEKYKNGEKGGENVFQDPMDIFREIMKDHQIPGPMGAIIGDILQSMSQQGGPPGIIFNGEGPFDGRAGGRLKHKHHIIMGGSPFGFPPGFGPPPGFPGGGGGGSGGKRGQTVMHMERIMRDKDGHVFKVVEEKVLGPGEMPDIPGMAKGMGIHPSAINDPIKALKQLQKLHEMQEKQADEMMSLLFMLFFIGVVLSAFKRQSFQGRNSHGGVVVEHVDPALAQALARRAQAQAEMKRKQQEDEAKKKRRGDRGAEMEMSRLYNNSRSNGSKRVYNNHNRVVSPANSVDGVDLTTVGGKIARRKVEEGINAVAKTASGVKQRVMASYRKAVKRGKKD